MGQVDVDGLAVRADDSGGTGRPLVLLHGGVLTAELSFASLLPRLGGRRTVAVDLRAHGRTPDPGGELSIPVLVRDLLGLLDALGVAEADLLGFSLGGMVAVEFAVRHPRRVRSLVAASVVGSPDGGYELVPGDSRMPTDAHFAQMRDTYDAVAPDPAHFDAGMERIGAMVHSWPGWSGDELRRITARTLVLVGDHDFVRVAHAARMAETIPDAGLAVLPRTTHMDLTHRVALLVPLLAEHLDPAAYGPTALVPAPG